MLYIQINLLKIQKVKLLLLIFQKYQTDISGKTLEETKEEAVDTAPETTEQVVEEVKTNEEKKEDDSQLEDYSKGVQSRIAKLTRKMREAERREQAALDYAKGVEEKRQILEKRLKAESELVKNDSMNILKDFEKIDYAD